MKKTLRNFLEVILDTDDPDRELEALFFACSWLHRNFFLIPPAVAPFRICK